MAAGHLFRVVYSDPVQKMSRKWTTSTGASAGRCRRWPLAAGQARAQGRALQWCTHRCCRRRCPACTVPIRPRFSSFQIASDRRSSRSCATSRPPSRPRCAWGTAPQVPWSSRNATERSSGASPSQPLHSMTPRGWAAPAGALRHHAMAPGCVRYARRRHGRPSPRAAARETSVALPQEAI
jgi:hypothetical protein